jgi:hypothetical protein
MVYAEICRTKTLINEAGCGGNRSFGWQRLQNKGSGEWSSLVIAFAECGDLGLRAQHHDSVATNDDCQTCGPNSGGLTSPTRPSPPKYHSIIFGL